MELNIFATPFNVEAADVPHLLQLEIIQLQNNSELKARYLVPRIRWCGIGGFQEQVQCLFVGLVALLFCLQLFSLSLLFFYRLVV